MKLCSYCGKRTLSTYGNSVRSGMCAYCYCHSASSIIGLAGNKQGNMRYDYDPDVPRSRITPAIVKTLSDAHGVQFEKLCNRYIQENL